MKLNPVWKSRLDRFSFSSIISFCIGEKKGNNIEQLTSWHSCREMLVKYFVEETNTKFNDRKYKVLVGFCSKLQPKTIKGEVVNSDKLKESIEKERVVAAKEILRVVNMMESVVNWPKTKLLEISDPGLERQGIAVFGLNHSSKWLSSTQLMSLFGLLIRLAKTHVLSEVHSVDDLSPVMEKKAKEHNIRSYSQGDVAFAYHSYKSWTIMMRAYKTLITDYGTGKVNFYEISKYGIDNLVKGKAQGALYKKWERISKKLSKTKEAKNV